MEKCVGAVALNPCVDKTVFVDRLVPYGLNRVTRMRLDPGGKGLNVARILTNFGVKTLLSGFVASRQSEFLLNWLSGSGMECDLHTIDGDTRVNRKVVDESAGRTTEINEPGFRIPQGELAAYEERFCRLLERLDTVVLSGRLPPGVCEDFYARCICAAKARGVRAVLDADAGALKAGLGAVPYAVKPNLHELESLYGRAFAGVGDVADAARNLVASGIGIVIVSMGEDGAVIADGHDVYKADTWPVCVKSTVGAGDSMVGALVYGLRAGMDTPGIARLATAAGTIAASREGTEFCTLAEARAAMDKVTLTRL